MTEDNLYVGNAKRYLRASCTCINSDKYPIVAKSLDEAEKKLILHLNEYTKDECWKDPRVMELKAGAGEIPLEKRIEIVSEILYFRGNVIR